MFIFTTKTSLLQPSLKNFSPKKIESWNIGLPRKNVLIKPSNTAYSKDQPIKLWLGSKKKVHELLFFYFFPLRKAHWCFDLGDNYLNTHTNVGQTREETQKLLEEHNSFKEKAKETREKVKLLLQLADTLMEKGHAHAPSIKSWVEEVDETYKDFSTRMDKYRSKLEAHLGIPSVQDPLSLDNTSITSKDSLDSGHVTASSRLSSTSEATSTSNNLQVCSQFFQNKKIWIFREINASLQIFRENN